MAALLRGVRVGMASCPMKPEGISVSTRTLSNWTAFKAEMARKDAHFIWVCTFACCSCVLGIALDEEVNQRRSMKAKDQAAPESRPTAC